MYRLDEMRELAHGIPTSRAAERRKIVVEVFYVVLFAGQVLVLAAFQNVPPACWAATCRCDISGADGIDRAFAICSDRDSPIVIGSYGGDDDGEAHAEIICQCDAVQTNMSGVSSMVFAGTLLVSRSRPMNRVP